MAHRPKTPGDNKRYKIGININPLFSIICVFLNIFVLLVGLINDIFINAINLVILILNEVLEVICDITVFIGNVITSLEPNQQINSA